MNGITLVQLSGDLMHHLILQPWNRLSTAGVVCLLPILCLGIMLSESASAQPPIKIQPRQQTAEAPESTAPLPLIIPSPRVYDSADSRPFNKSKTETLGRPPLVTEINRRQNFQIWLSRTVKATSAGPGDSTYQFVNPSNREDIEVPYESKITANNSLREFKFGAPWQFPYKIQKGTIAYRFTKTPFVSVHGIEELDALYADFLKYSPVLTRNSLLFAYSPRDNLFQRDSMLRLRKDVPESLLDKMNHSEIDEQLIESRQLFDRNGPCELRTILWLSGLLEKVEDSREGAESADGKIEVLTNVSEPVLVYQEGMYYYIYNQCYLTAIRSTLEPDVIHLCVIEFEMHKYQDFISGILPNIYELGEFRYKLSRTWSLGTLK